MEVEEDNKRPAEEAAITTNNIIYSPNLAPIAQPEIHEELNEVVEPEIQQELPSSSSVQYSESIILPIGGNEKKQKFGMLRLRRKRRQDPFGNLILSTKKMKLNDLGEPINGQAQAPNGIKQNASASNMQVSILYSNKNRKNPRTMNFSKTVHWNVEMTTNWCFIMAERMMKMIRPMVMMTMRTQMQSSITKMTIRRRKWSMSLKMSQQARMIILVLHIIINKYHLLNIE
jgi:hypothetical protein